MKSYFVVGSLVGTALFLGGCYTVLMTPSDLESSEGSNGYYSGTASAAELNYGSNCLSCHSSSELDDRYDEMQSLGIHTVHGMVIDPYGWRNPNTSIPWWYTLNPPPIPASGVSQSSGGNGNSTSGTSQKRNVGETRGDGTSASSAPQSPSGNSASAPATGNASSASQQPRETAQPSQSSAPRSRDSGNDSSGTTRKTGSTRGSGK